MTDVTSPTPNNPAADTIRQRSAELLRDVYQQQDKARVDELKRQWMRVLPPALREVRWSHIVKAQPPIDPTVLQRVDEWCKNPTHNLVLCGEPGVGKTWMAVAAMRRVLRNTHTFDFQVMPEVLESWRDRSGRPVNLVAPHWLLLDELGGPRALSDLELERLWVVINRRSLNQLHTIVTSNLDAKSLSEWASERVFDRLRQGVVIEWPGSSRR
jgi:DNA replication protein DnaC